MKAKIKDLQENEMKFGIDSQDYPDSRQESGNDSNQDYYSREDDSEYDGNQKQQQNYEENRNLGTLSKEKRKM